MHLATVRFVVRAACALLVVSCGSSEPTASSASNMDVSLGAASAALAPGAQTSVSVFVARDDIAGTITLAATGLPSGVTASFSPATLAEGTTLSTLTLTADADAAPGSATITVTATVGDSDPATATLTLTVGEGAGDNTTPVVVDFCTTPGPALLAYRNEGGAWTRVFIGPDGRVTFNATPTVSFVIANASSDLKWAYVYHMTAEELAKLSPSCVVNSGTKILSGSVANVPSGATAMISMGGSAKTASSTQTSFTLDKVPTGQVDLVAGYRIGPTTSEVIIRRDVDLNSGSVLPVLDFNSAESKPMTVNDLTVTGPELTSVQVDARFLTNLGGTGLRSGITTQFGGFSAAGTTIVSVPASLLRTTDMHELTISADGASRATTIYYRNPIDHAVRMGAPLATPVVTSVAASPYQRYRAQFAAGEYIGAGRLEVSQTGKTFQVWVTAGYLGTTPSTWDITMPDLSNVPGWSDSYGLASGVPTSAYVAGLDKAVINFFAVSSGGPVEEGTYRSASEIVTIEE